MMASALIHGLVHGVRSVTQRIENQIRRGLAAAPGKNSGILLKSVR